MIKKLVPGLILALITSLIVPWVGSAAPASTTYGFEECNEGWKVEENDPNAPGGDWTRTPPGDGSTMAFRIFPYPIGGAGSPGDTYETMLVAPVHSIAGGNIKIAYSLAHNTEATYDFLHFETSTNGTSWDIRKTYDGLSEAFPTFIKEEVTFAHPGGRLYARFRLTSDQLVSGNGNDGQVAVDDVTFPAARPAGAGCGGGGGDDPPPPKCTKSGNGNNNTLRGTAKADRLCGKGGKDRLYGKGGKDVLLGGRGKDTCIGGPGKDTFKSCETKKQ